MQWKRIPQSGETVSMYTFKNSNSIPVIILQGSWYRGDRNKALYIVYDVKKFLEMENAQQYDLIRAAADVWNPPSTVSKYTQSTFNKFQNNVGGRRKNTRCTRLTRRIYRTKRTYRKKTRRTRRNHSCRK